MPTVENATHLSYWNYRFYFIYSAPMYSSTHLRYLPLRICWLVCQFQGWFVTLHGSQSWLYSTGLYWTVLEVRPVEVCCLLLVGQREGWSWTSGVCGSLQHCTRCHGALVKSLPFSPLSSSAGTWKRLPDEFLVAPLAWMPDWCCSWKTRYKRDNQRKCKTSR